MCSSELPYRTNNTKRRIMRHYTSRIPWNSALHLPQTHIRFSRVSCPWCERNILWCFCKPRKSGNLPQFSQHPSNGRGIFASSRSRCACFLLILFRGVFRISIAQDSSRYFRRLRWVSHTNLVPKNTLPLRTI